MTTYKLTYFDGTGRGELTRWVFAAANQKYEDHRIVRGQWVELKPNTPFGGIPILEVDGVVLCQSNSIARFLARRFNLIGKTDTDAAQVDMITECATDMFLNFAKRKFGSDAEKEAAVKAWESEHRDTYLTKFDKLLAKNNGGDGYLVGDSLTLADMAVVVLFYILNTMDTLDLTNFPKLQALKTKVEADPGIAKWLASRAEKK